MWLLINPFHLFSFWQSFHFYSSYQVRVSDGIEYVKEISRSEPGKVLVSNQYGIRKLWVFWFKMYMVHAEGKGPSKIDVLIIDVDASDSRYCIFSTTHLCNFTSEGSLYYYLTVLLCSSGLTCPASDFVEESFLSTAKNSISEEGLFIINLVTRSSSVKEAVYARLKTVRIDTWWLCC